MRVDLNADLGESYGSWRMGDDDALLDVVTSANVACGFHAGDPVTMLRPGQRVRFRRGREVEDDSSVNSTVAVFADRGAGVKDLG